MLKSNATEADKSLALAEMMGWEQPPYYPEKGWIELGDSLMEIEPYGVDSDGLAQFAAILLKFPEVLPLMAKYNRSSGDYEWYLKPTQANILDEILRMQENNDG